MVVATPQILIAGLGNLPFPSTRHSVGHLIIDALASRLGITLVNDRSLGGYFGSSNVYFGVHSVKVSLFKPKALMNISGSQVASALSKTSPTRSPTSLILIHDSLSHKPLTISPKLSGSANGHNGVKSVISALGNQQGFWRLRVGIGKNEGVDAAEYVLSKLSREEREFWGRGEGVDLVWKEVEKIMGKSFGSG
ncbi:hypothetical protein JAAARDRAFT_58018 [Jaapia argillacea MUCL 33604]|uniref:peptidyl-tRNA hydrolase n=1 Tax=Jaapia argillacea MUCL 33604 TaxID=933084 RepID=A0A067PU83_9AGAM|nr:hypothetical protein JAAARDRAFT_58018 [Jaapia argillacea MUCL 33604]